MGEEVVIVPARPTSSARWLCVIARKKRKKKKKREQGNFDFDCFYFFMQETRVTRVNMRSRSPPPPRCPGAEGRRAQWYCRPRADTTTARNFCQVACFSGVKADPILAAMTMVRQSASSCTKEGQHYMPLYFMQLLYSFMCIRSNTFFLHLQHFKCKICALDLACLQYCTCIISYLW